MRMSFSRLLSVALTGLSLTAFSESAALPPLRPHPRLFANEQTFADLKARLATDEMVRVGAEHVKALSEKYLSDPLPKHGITDGRRMLSTSHDVEERVLNLAMAYRLFGDRRYLSRAEEIMVSAAEMPDWNPSHFLDVAVMSYGVATAYDWLFSDLSSDARMRIRTGLERNGVDAGLRRKGLCRGRSNWAQVCPGGVLVAALAIAEDAPEKCARIVRTVTGGLPDVMQMYRPNGSYPEGPGYWGFGTGYNVIAIAALESAYGTDFGLASQPAFRETGRYPDLMTGPSGFRFNYADCGHRRAPSWIVWWFAKRFGEPALVEPYERNAYLKNLKGVRSPMFLLYAFPRDVKAAVDLPLAWRSGGTVDVSVQRSSWEPDGRFAALKGGRATSPHGHMDGGSFVYDAKGVRWAWDLGGENYSKIEHRIGMELWRYAEGSGRYRVFRHSAAAHNTLTLDGQPHCATGTVSVVSLTDGPESESVLDLSPLFTNATKVVRRGQMLADGFRLTDEVAGLRAGAPIRWQMMTCARVTPKGVDELELRESGQVLSLRRETPSGASDWVVDEAPHGESWEQTNKGFRRISFTVPSNPSGTTFSVVFR